MTVLKEKPRNAQAKHADEDPFAEINSPAFLESLSTGSSTAKKAFARLFECIHPHLHRFVGRYFNSPESVQDILQETFIGVHRGLARFEGRSRLSTWIFSLAYNKACDQLSESYRSKANRAETMDAAQDLPIADPLPDERLHQTRFLEWVESAASKIPKIYSEVYFLRDQEALSGEETALILNITPALVRLRLHRARAMIVELLRRKTPDTCKEYGVR